ncbi:FadR/GntR family transcriptional regulator [uncultured Microbacterium sp.]|uniref:FadR/GntR family transcriptional regulator n=1 Tax=uncultured Microbacterium sp. TaxID=191216 RepID=UPI0028DC5688|nr:FadR/GntR family transcriptional regulator [uncultured Microbacterium sp.]
MEFTQLQREPSLASRVTESMLATIASGRFSPGDWLPSERELSDQFGVSRTVIREAVRGLEAKGVVEVRSGRGARVAHVSSSRVSESLQLYLSGAQSQQLLGPAEISEVRGTLELRLVELACEKASDADLDEIQASLDAMADAATPVQAAADDAEFHRRIALATHNALYVALLESLNAVMMPIREHSLELDGRRERTLAQHGAVLDALRARDPRRAREAMGGHLDDSRQYYEPVDGTDAS